jgi:hypothetical protein
MIFVECLVIDLPVVSVSPIEAMSREQEAESRRKYFKI